MVNLVSIIGLGAVGAIYAWRLSEYLGYDRVRVILDETRIERYRREGIFLNGQRIEFNYVGSRDEVEPADLLLLATKNNHLAQAMENCVHHVGSGTAILSLLNGIDSEQVLAERFGQEKVLYGFTTALDSTRVANHIDFSTEGIIYFGERNNLRTERIVHLSHLFSEAKITYRIPENIERELWVKFMVNVSINTISAITRGTYGECASIKELSDLIVETQREVITLAKAAGIEGLDESYIDKYQKIFASLEYHGKTSMLQDFEAGRPTENRWFCIRASELGRQLGIPTPLIDVLGRITSASEAVLTSRH